MTKFLFHGIDHVQLAAPKGCEEKARFFYGAILGLPEIKKPEILKGRGGCWFQCGNQELHIGVEADFREAKKAHPGLIVKNIEELKSILVSNQIAMKEEPVIEGRKRIHVSDPFGNRLEFLEFIQE
ncbi:VOC family protein [Heyndrickxia vini]|uniref:VOC family protein n=1 Tax=Heyndrickxia vini TaxID=1476025 RepID=A0ABX7DXT5_9BACI|nr:VOC family protein [Heyndrickxia vini]QQZ07870.1 VOC family protein [Heyndrickxia vini]